MKSFLTQRMKVKEGEKMWLIIRVQKDPELMKSRRMAKRRKLVSFSHHRGHKSAATFVLQESFIFKQKLKRKKKQRTAVQRRLTPKGDGCVPPYWPVTNPVHWLDKTQRFQMKLFCIILQIHFYSKMKKPCVWVLELLSIDSGAATAVSIACLHPWPWDFVSTSLRRLVLLSVLLSHSKKTWSYLGTIPIIQLFF